MLTAISQAKQLPSLSAYAAQLPAARRVLTEKAAMQGQAYVDVLPERTPDLAYALALFASHGPDDSSWQTQACLFPSGIKATPATMFGIYDLSDERLREETRIAV